MRYSTPVRLVRAMFTLLGAICLSMRPALAIEKPTGTFSSAGGMQDDIYANPQLRGVLVRAPWRLIEPSPGNFDFSMIDRQVKKIESMGKQWSLGVIGGGTGSPDWLTGKGKAAFIEYAFRGKPGYRLPLFWDAFTQERLTRLAKALAAEYGDHANLSLVYVTQMTANGLEGHLQGVDMSVLKQAGYTDQKWIDAVKSAAITFARAFPDKAIAVEVHDINGGAEVPGKIINELWADPALHHRVGAAMWWLSGRDNYQADLIKVLTKYPGDIYAQVIGNSGQTHRFEPDGYAAVFTQARKIGIRYIEPWEYEFGQDRKSAHGAWDKAMADFNRWADEHYPKQPQAAIQQ